MIIKIQKPILSSLGPIDPNLAWLFYNETRSIMFQAPANGDLIEKMGDEYKIFVEATQDQNGSQELLIFGDIVPDPGW